MVKIMNKQNLHYHIFLFLSTFTRGLVEIFSLVLLAQKGYQVTELLLFLFLMYTFGILVNYISLKLNYKLILILSSILFSVSFLFLSTIKHNTVQLIIFALLLSSSTYSLHAIRHSLALLTLSKKTTILITITYLGNILANILSIILIQKLPLIITGIIISILSLISLWPALKFQPAQPSHIPSSKSALKIPRTKILFNIFEQFKVIFLELQPLFLYLYVDNSIAYVGIFNLIANIASLIVVYFLSKHLNLKYFKYLCLLLSLVLLLKLTLKNHYFLLLIALIEGVLIKIYENVSLENLYCLDNNPIIPYLITEELIFFITKSILLLIAITLKLSLSTIMYLCLIGIAISGFFIQAPSTKTSSNS